MPIRSLTTSLRLLLGIIGLAALGAGTVVAIRELRAIALGAPWLLTSLVAVAGLVVAFGGATLLGGAMRGTILVRPTRP